MIIAQTKRNENIAEYLLYMWQIEDLIRANEFDIDKIAQHVVAGYNASDSLRLQITTWYQELIDMMLTEGVKESGHIQINKNIIIALTDLHLRLLQSPEEMVYNSTYYKTLPYIVQLRAKAGEGKSTSEIETCFVALYGVLILKMQQKTLSTETLEAVNQITLFIAQLAEKYHTEKRQEAEEQELK